MAYYLGELDRHGNKRLLIQMIEDSAEARSFRAGERRLAAEVAAVVRHQDRLARSWLRFFRGRARARQMNVLTEFICNSMGRVVGAVSGLERLQAANGPSQPVPGADPARVPNRRRAGNKKLMQQLLAQVRADVAKRKSDGAPPAAKLDRCAVDEVATTVSKFAMTSGPD